MAGTSSLTPLPPTTCPPAANLCIPSGLTNPPLRPNILPIGEIIKSLTIILMISLSIILAILENKSLNESFNFLLPWKASWKADTVPSSNVLPTFIIKLCMSRSMSLAVYLSVSARVFNVSSKLYSPLFILNITKAFCAAAISSEKEMPAFFMRSKFVSASFILVFKSSWSISASNCSAASLLV